MINYILQVVLFQALFLAVYDFFLQKETFFNWNRVYLLLTPILSFLIPLVKFDTFQQAVPQEYIVHLPEVFLNPGNVIEQNLSTESTFNSLQFLFIVGAVFFTVLFLIRLYKILSLINVNNVIDRKQYKLVLLNKMQSAFSFFNYIFINKQLNERTELEIIQHELVHCRQKHTLDLLVFEVLKILMWFNPLIYIYQQRITLLHEYISDAEIVKETDKKTYFNTLLLETFSVENITFINQFFKQSLIKKRIVMITKNKSEKIKQLKYLILIPLLMGMLVYTSCTTEKGLTVEELNLIIQDNEIPPNGKYFESSSGEVVFLGQNIQGESISYENMTANEKELYDALNNSESKLTYSVVLDSKGDRVHFINVPKPPMKNTIEPDSDDVAFTKIDEVPIYPGCENNEDAKTCFQKNISSFVGENFDFNISNKLELEQGLYKIFVMFKIDKEGQITDVKARAPKQELSDEAIRVIKSLPKMIPGKQDGKPVNVKYSLPIAFKVD